MPNLQNFKGSSFCRSLGRSLGPKLRPNQDSVDLCLYQLDHALGFEYMTDVTLIVIEIINIL